MKPSACSKKLFIGVKLLNLYENIDFRSEVTRWHAFHEEIAGILMEVYLLFFELTISNFGKTKFWSFRYFD